MSEYQVTALVIAALCLVYCLAQLAKTIREFADAALEAEERAAIDRPRNPSEHPGNLQHTPLVRRGPGGEYERTWPQD